MVLTLGCAVWRVSMASEQARRQAPEVTGPDIAKDVAVEARVVLSRRRLQIVNAGHRGHFIPYGLPIWKMDASLDWLTVKLLVPWRTDPRTTGLAILHATKHH